MLKCQVLKSGVKRYVHVHTLNCAGVKTPVVVVRYAADPDRQFWFEKAEILGPSTLDAAAKNSSVPGKTCLETCGPIKVFYDDNKPYYVSIQEAEIAEAEGSGQTPAGDRGDGVPVAEVRQPAASVA